MAKMPEELRELATSTMARAELLERAAALVRAFPECFWFWHPDARVRSLEDGRLAVEHLR